MDKIIFFNQGQKNYNIYVIGPLHTVYSTFIGREFRIQGKYLGKEAAKALA